MRISSKKFFSVLLAGLMLFSIPSCGNTAEKDDQTMPAEAPTENITEGETLDPDYVCDLPDDLNFGNTEVNFLYVKKDGRDDELPSDKLGLGTVSDAVYERNLTVENSLGIKLKFTDEADDEKASTTIDTMVKAGDSSLDLYSLGSYYAIGSAIEGCFLDLTRLEYMNTSKHYWSQEYNELMTFTSENMQFLATSPAALSLFRLTYLTIFNRDLFTDRQLPDLYEAVENGGWTLDYQYNMISDVYVDQDGNGTPSEGDFYGFITGDTISVDPYCVASDIHFIIRDENGDWVSNGDVMDDTITMSEKVSALYNTQGTYVYEGTDHDDIGKYSIIEKFAEQEGLMATTQFLSIEKRINSLAGINYGIVPVPKLSREQPAYYTYVQDQVSGFGVSAAIGDRDRQDLLGAVMESIAYNSYLIVRPAYYDSTLSLRFMQDPQSGDILDTMFETISFDRAFVSCPVDIKGTMRNRLTQTNPALASQVAAWGKSLKNQLTKEQKKVDQLLNK